MPHRQLVSPDGRNVYTVTSQDEYDRLKAVGFEAPSKHRGDRDPLNSGNAGQLLARASSTTNGQERNTGQTVDLSQLDESQLLDEIRRRRAEAAEAQAEAKEAKAQLEDAHKAAEANKKPEPKQAPKSTS